jgi:transcriptional regulator with XRE-family HTH domain
MTRDFDQRIGGNIQRTRNTAGWSQADLAGRLTDHGLSFPQQTINRIEHGERPLKFEEALAIADLLGVTVASLAQHFSNENVAAAAAEIQHAKILKTRTEKNAEESHEAWQRSVAWSRHFIEVQERRIREAEQRLRDHGAVQDDDGRWHLNGTVIDV